MKTKMMKIITILLACFVLFTNIACADDEPYDDPSLSIKAAEGLDLNLEPGETFNLKLVVKNTTGIRAKEIKLMAELDNELFSWVNYNGEINLGYLYGNKFTETELKIKVNENAKKGVYPITLKATYENKFGNMFNSEGKVYVNISKQLFEPMLQVDKTLFSTETVSADVPFDMSLYLLNGGGITARNVKVTLEGFDEDTFLPRETMDTKYEEYILPGSVGIFTYPLIAGDSAHTGINKLTAKLSYYDDNGKEYTDSKTIYINLTNGTVGGESTKAKPKIIITSYHTSVSPIKTGKKFDLDFGFINTSSSKIIRNLKVTISSNDGTFNILNGTNSFWINELVPGEEIKKTIGMRAKNDAVSNSYPVSIKFDYEDREGDAYESTEEIYVQVVEDLKIRVTDVEEPYEAFVDTPTDISFEVYNFGKATVSNITADVEGDFTLEGEISYLGNLDGGKNDYYEVSIIPNKSGDVSGNLIITFEDTNGDKTQLKKFVKFNVIETFEFEEPTDMEMPMEIPEKPGMRMWLLMISCIGAFVITTFVTKMIIMCIYNKKIESEI